MSTNQNITTLFLQQTFVTFNFNAIVNENLNEFYNEIFFESL